MEHYDIEKIKKTLEEKNINLFNKNIKINDDLFLLFKNDNEKVKRAYEELKFNYIFKFNNNEYYYIYSLYQNGYITTDFLNDKLIGDSNLNLYLYNYNTLESVPEPKKWLEFLKINFNYNLNFNSKFQQNENINLLIRFICFKYIELFTNLNNYFIFENNRGSLVICLNIFPESVFLDDKEEKDKALVTGFLTVPDYDTFDNNNVDLDIHTIPNIFCDYKIYSSFSFGKEISPFFFESDVLEKDLVTKFNVFFLLKSTSFNRTNWKYILFKALIMGFYSCNSLLLPGTNLSTNINNIDYYEKYTSNQTKYMQIVEQEYLLIIAYIFKELNKKYEK